MPHYRGNQIPGVRDDGDDGELDLEVQIPSSPTHIQDDGDATELAPDAPRPPRRISREVEDVVDSYIEGLGPASKETCAGVEHVLVLLDRKALLHLVQDTVDERAETSSIRPRGVGCVGLSLRNPCKQNVGVVRKEPCDQNLAHPDPVSLSPIPRGRGYCVNSKCQDGDNIKAGMEANNSRVFIDPLSRTPIHEADLPPELRRPRPPRAGLGWDMPPPRRAAVVRNRDLAVRDPVQEIESLSPAERGVLHMRIRAMASMYLSTAFSDESAETYNDALEALEDRFDVAAGGRNVWARLTRLESRLEDLGGQGQIDALTEDSRARLGTRLYALASRYLDFDELMMSWWGDSDMVNATSWAEMGELEDGDILDALEALEDKFDVAALGTVWERLTRLESLHIDREAAANAAPGPMHADV